MIIFILFELVSWLFLTLQILVPMSVFYCLMNWGMENLGTLGFIAFFPLLTYVTALSFCFTLLVVRFLIPRPTEGVSAFPTGRNSVLWSLHLAQRRIAGMPLISTILSGGTLMKWCFLKAQGADAAMVFNCSNDVIFNDPLFTVIGKNSLIGSQARLYAHSFVSGRLELSKCQVGENAQVHGHAQVGPGCSLGKDSILGAYSKLSLHVSVGENSKIGYDSTIGKNVKIGNNVVIGNQVYIENNCVIEDGANIPARSHILRGAIVSPSLDAPNK